MLFRFLADVTAVVHGAFFVYVALGGFLAWKWPKAWWPHAVAVAWGIGIVAVGWECPLTALQRLLEEQGGEPRHPLGFVDRYVEGELYPERYSRLVQAFVLVAIGSSWVGARRRVYRCCDRGRRTRTR